MKIKPHLIRLFIVLYSCLSSQLFGQGFLINAVKTLETRNAISKKYSDIEGSPYYTDKFINSVAYLKDGNYAKIPLRYDLFQDQMEFMKDNLILWLTRKDIKYIRYGNEMIFVSSADGDTTKLGYYFLRDEGKIMLFYKKVIIYQPMISPKGYSSSVPDKFIPDKDQIYIKKENMPARKIVMKRDLISVFAGDKSALEFIKKNRIKPDNIEDIHRLVSFLNVK